MTEVASTSNTQHNKIIIVVYYSSQTLTTQCTTSATVRAALGCTKSTEYTEQITRK